MKKNLLFIIAVLSSCWIHAQTNERANAIRLVEKNSAAIGLSSEELSNVIISDAYFNKMSGTEMVYIQQGYKTIPVYNQLKVLAFKNELPVSISGDFIQSINKRVNIKDGIPATSPESAVLAAISDRKLISSQSPIVINQDNSKHKFEFSDLGVSRENITAQLVWVPIIPGKRVRLAWQIYIIPQTTSDYWMIRVDATNNTILGMDNYTVYCNWDLPKSNEFFSNNKTAGTTYNFDFHQSRLANNEALLNSPLIVNNAAYRVVPFPAESPSHPGGTPVLVSNPWTAAPGNATSLKWNSDGTTDFTNTRGNNVLAQEDANGNNGNGASPTSTTTPNLTFDFVPNFTVTPTQTAPAPNRQFNTTNLFYWNNIAHDITYLYGFDEASGNFQDNNQGRGGLGSDHVNADAQDGAGTNNANFATPADGSNPRMQMFLWTGSPDKDGDADNGVIVHEFGHGISNRLTGGPSQSGCLGNAEQMGEGWSDYYCLMYTQDWANSNLNTGFNTPRAIGTYVISQPPTGSGIRNQRYCTNFAVNNRVYNTTISSESHSRGEIWCATLWDMTWNIINQVGTINPSIYDASGSGGNAIALKLVTEGMKLQPCSPGFIDGRDAILRADQLLYNGLYDCAIREAFRRRGMGAFASQGSSGSVTDQIPDYTAGGATMILTQNGMTEVPEGGFITYTNTVSTTACAPLSNFVLTDTLPANVTYVSGGTYNAATRVVSFPVNLAAAQTENYSFTVQVNAGAYFPTVTLFEDNVAGASIPSAWTTNSTTAVNWVSTNARSHSAPNSYYSFNQDIQSDQKIFFTTAIALGPTPPPLSFWHWYSLESTYDGGVLEISTDGGTVWNDLGPNIISNGYTGIMDATTIIPGRAAWTGSSNNQFIKTKVNLSSYANQNVKIRFRHTTDVGTNLEGWYIDDIAIKDQAVVEMRTSFFTQAGFRVAISDTITIITPPVTCSNVAVTSEPASINICTGNNASFNVTADGTDPEFQWQVSTDGGVTFSDIPGATATTLSLTAVTAGMNNNQYHVVINNACPSSITSGAATLTVSDPAAITAQPTDLTTCEGNAANFSVTASGSANTYQWQVSTNGGVTFTDIPGATAATLTVSNVTPAMNNNQYHAVISSCIGVPLNSGNAILTVTNAATIVNNPADVTACQATDAVFTSLGAGTNISYQWQVSTDGGLTFTNIPGATSATLTVSNVSPASNNNVYHVVVSNICTASVVSGNAILTVSNIALINTQPVNTTACEGSDITITTSSSGTSYQWEVSTNGGASFTPVPGATTPNLTLTNVTAAMDGNQYHLMVLTCGPGSITSNNITLTVVVPVSITTQPVNQAVCEGSDAGFTVAASGSSINYIWEVSTDGGISYTPVPGGTNPGLNLTGVDMSMDGYLYRAVLSNFCTVNFTSDAAVLSVSLVTVINTPVQDKEACVGSDVVFFVDANGSGLAYQWQVSTDGGTNYTDLPGATSSTLSLSAVTNTMNNNRYRVMITGCTNLTSNAAVLTVHASPVVTISAAPYSNLTTNLTTTLTAIATPPSITFNWFRDGVSVSGITTSTITITHNDLGIYTATVTDINGCTGVSNALAIGDSTGNIAFISPNPTTGYFEVRFDGIEPNNQPRLITMYDAKGARVLQQANVVLSPYEPMPVHGEKLSSGVYVVVLTNSKGDILKKGQVIIRR